MPVIGSYRGCDSCRKWKKKCDSVEPGKPCSRCSTRNIPCVGVGQQRFKFKNQSSVSRQTGHLQGQEVAIRFTQAAVPRLPKSPLRSDNEIIGSTLMHILGSNHLGYNLKPYRISVFGELPKRIGSSVALDASLAAFISILQTQQSPLEQLNPKSRQLYFSGLSALQKSFQNPIERGHPNTLCAAFILGECDVWATNYADITRGYGEGIVHLMSDIVCQDLTDPFLRGVCSSMTANLLQDSVFSPNVKLDTWMEELYDLPGQPLGSSMELQNMSRLPTCELGVLAMIPDLIRYPRQNIARIQWAYNYILDRYIQVKVFIAANKDTSCWNTYDGLVCNERHGLFIAIGITLNAFLRAHYPNDMLLVSQQSIFCADAVSLAERAKHERPLAAHHVPHAIVSACCVTKDNILKERLQQLIEDYRDTFSMARFVQNISYWPAAPDALQEIPLFTLCHAKENSGVDSTDGGTNRRAETTEGGMQEYCCIL